MKLTYDPAANVAYLRLRERVSEVETIELSADLLVDMDETCAVCGLKFLNANEHLVQGNGGKIVLSHALTGGVAELDVA